jgi:hypothetical protein
MGSRRTNITQVEVNKEEIALSINNFPDEIGVASRNLKKLGLKRELLVEAILLVTASKNKTRIAAFKL